MNALTFAMPILPGKTEAWKEFIKEMEGSRRSQAKELLKQGGVSRIRCWLQETPNGDLAIVIHEGPDPKRWLPTVMESKDEVAEWFRGQISEIHGLSKDGPPPPDNELITDLEV